MIFQPATIWIGPEKAIQTKLGRSCRKSGKYHSKQRPRRVGKTEKTSNQERYKLIRESLDGKYNNKFKG